MLQYAATILYMYCIPIRIAHPVHTGAWLLDYDVQKNYLFAICTHTFYLCVKIRQCVKADPI